MCDCREALQPRGLETSYWNTTPERRDDIKGSPRHLQDHQFPRWLLLQVLHTSYETSLTRDLCYEGEPASRSGVPHASSCATERGPRVSSSPYECGPTGRSGARLSCATKWTNVRVFSALIKRAFVVSRRAIRLRVWAKIWVTISVMAAYHSSSVQTSIATLYGLTWVRSQVSLKERANMLY